MARLEHHVVSNENGGWDILKSGASRVSAHCDTKANAIARAREISRNQKSEMIIHNLDGKISRTDSHGSDPCPPRDKR